jgi:hypothetical protein
MKRVLIIGSDFVPSSLPPATRIRFFAKHLPEFGWEPIVLTTKSEFYDWPTDPENERLLSDSLSVIRTDAWRSSWTRRIGIGDVGMRSLWHHWRALKRLCKQTKIDLIFIPVPPSISMVLGRMAQKKFGIPYVVDYIDPWVTEYYWKVPRKQRPPKWPLAYALSRLVEPYALRKVSHITGVSKGTTDTVVSRYSWLAEGDATEIPYGAAAEDFSYLRLNPRRNVIFDPHDGLLHISYVGACIPGMYPAVRALFAGVRLGLEQEPELFGRLRLHFVGTSYSANGNAIRGVTEIARRMGLKEYVDEMPTRLAYLDSLQIMLDSHGLVLVGSDEPHYTASKVFPYLLSHRPLLAIFHEKSSVVEVLRNSMSGRTVTFNSAKTPEMQSPQILRELRRMLTHQQQDRLQLRSPMLEQFTTRAMASRLSIAFDRVIGGQMKDAPGFVATSSASTGAL